MLRLAAGAARGDHISPHCNCNSLPVGNLCGVPIRCSIFLAMYALYTAVGMAGSGAPWWAVLLLLLGSLALLVITILVHEFGHGLTARHLGGEISHIHLGPLGGLCVHTMPPHGSAKEKLANDWWVSQNGPITHLVMTPAWIGICALVFLAHGQRYSWGDAWSDLNPLDHRSSLSSHPQVYTQGWGTIVLLHLCTTAISFNVALFLFNLLFPMYPLDGSKLLVTGMQLCGTPVQQAARRLVWISGFCVLALVAAAAYQLYKFIEHAQRHAQDFDKTVQMVGMGFVPIPFPILLMGGLAFWGARQTMEINELANSKRLHSHPLFEHVPRTSRAVRDVAGGRPDRMVEQWNDQYEEDNPPPPPPPPPGYGAVRIRDGVIVRG